MLQNGGNPHPSSLFTSLRSLSSASLQTDLNNHVDRLCISLASKNRIGRIYSHFRLVTFGGACGEGACGEGTCIVNARVLLFRWISLGSSLSKKTRQGWCTISYSCSHALHFWDSTANSNRKFSHGHKSIVVQNPPGGWSHDICLR